MSRRAYLEIRLSAIENNFKMIQRYFNSEKFICPMVKDNAYGHGLLPVSRALEKSGAQHLGVTRVEEGSELRQGGVNCDILVFGDAQAEEYRELIHKNLTPVLSSWRQMEFLLKAIDQQGLRRKKIKVHIKFDTGMNRLGFTEADVSKLNKIFVPGSSFYFEGLLTHLSCAEDALEKASRSRRQLIDFEKIYQKLSYKPQLTHALNSAGLLRKFTSSKGSYLRKRNWGGRPGLMIYGVNPLPEPFPFHIENAMSLKSKPALIRKVKKGQSVSYGATWVAQQDSLLAVLPLGYGDGVPRRLSNRCFALADGEKFVQVGNICMDLMMIDITPLSKTLSIESLYEKEFVLLGQDVDGHKISASTLAKTVGTIPWEILVGFHDRLPRVYV